MNAVYEKLMRCYGSVRERIHFKPKVANLYYYIRYKADFPHPILIN